MVPAAVVDTRWGNWQQLHDKDDIVIDGGNSYYIDDIRRAKRTAGRRAFITSTPAPAAAFGDWSAATVR